MNSFGPLSNSFESFVNILIFWRIVLKCLGIVLNCLGAVLRLLGTALGILWIALGSSQRDQIKRPRQPLIYIYISLNYIKLQQTDLGWIRAAWSLQGTSIQIFGVSVMLSGTWEAPFHMDYFVSSVAKHIPHGETISVWTHWNWKFIVFEHIQLGTGRELWVQRDTALVLCARLVVPIQFFDGYIAIFLKLCALGYPFIAVAFTPGWSEDLSMFENGEYMGIWFFYRQWSQDIAPFWNSLACDNVDIVGYIPL